MVLNDVGEIAYNEWMELLKRYPNISLDAFQIMPNHIHGIIVGRLLRSPKIRTPKNQMRLPKT